MGEVDDKIEAAVAGDQQAIQDLGARVTASTEASESIKTALETSVKNLEAEIAQKASEGVDVATLEAHLADIKATADAIDPAAPAPVPQPEPAPAPSGE